MSTKKDVGHRARAQRVVRQGEGERATVIRNAAAGTGESNASISLGDVRVPDRRFASDVVSVKIGDDMVRMFFGQYDALGADLHALLCVQMSFVGTRQFLHT